VTRCSAGPTAPSPNTPSRQRTTWRPGRERVAYEVDAVHDELGILVEVEAGRGARGNAVYRDLVRSSLIVDQRFLVLGVMRSYRHQSSGRPIIVSSYRDSKDQLQKTRGRNVGVTDSPTASPTNFGWSSDWIMTLITE
jgi:hypothetical protein